jgi:ribosomal protein S18 acetylase RimI-like enzyme
VDRTRRSRSYEEWSGPSDTEGRWREYFAASGANFVAEYEGARVGLVRATATDDAREVELASLWVDPSARGRGVATALIAAVLSWSSAAFPDYAVRLNVARTNVAALALYEREGFRLVGVDPDDPTEMMMVHWSRAGR